MVPRFYRSAFAVAAACLLAACAADFSPTSPLRSSPDATLARSDNAGDRLPAPASVTVTVDGDAVAVSWTAVANAGEYMVQLCADAACSSSYRTIRTAATSASFTSVASGDWTVRVRARRDDPASATDENNGWGHAAFASATVASVVEPENSNADATPPVISHELAGTPSGDWYRSNVVVTWTVQDPDSPISASTGCGPTTVAQDGVVTLTCSATSAGGTSTVSVVVRRDVTAPAISFSGNAGSYTVDQSIAIVCAASDVTSGVASTSCPAVVAGDAFTFALGANSSTATAQDVAGNAATDATSFTVTVTHASVCTLVRRWVTNAGVANSLCVKLDAAARASARGNASAAAGPLGAFTNEVRAQTGKWIPTDKAAYLLSFVAAL